MPRPKQRTPELREHVLRVALAMLEREGFAAFTARRIAAEAETSMPAVYELFGDKTGLVRALFFEGFRLLEGRFAALETTADARAGLLATLACFRQFARENRVLSEVMFSRPFAEFDPQPAEQKAGTETRKFIVKQVRRCIEAGVLHGDETDIAHVLLALAQGLSAQENAGWLGTSKLSIERRWRLAFEATLRGLSGEPSR